MTRSHWRWLVVMGILPPLLSLYGSAAFYVLFGAMISAAFVVACRQA
jgi:hypothetical protein